MGAEDGRQKEAETLERVKADWKNLEIILTHVLEQEKFKQFSAPQADYSKTKEMTNGAKDTVIALIKMELEQTNSPISSEVRILDQRPFSQPGRIENAKPIVLNPINESSGANMSLYLSQNRGESGKVDYVISAYVNYNGART